MANANNTKIFEKEFFLAHALHDKGITNAEIARIMEVSQPTISRVLYYNDYELYCRDRKRGWIKKSDNIDDVNKNADELDVYESVHRIESDVHSIKDEIVSIHNILTKYMEV